jgi:hypothetical protein
MGNKEFIGWVAVKEANHNGQTWQYTQISFKLEDLEKMKGFMNEKGYVNLKLNRSQKGKEYLEIDTYGLNQNPMPPIEQGPMDAPVSQAAPTPPPMDFINGASDDEVPF